MRVHGAAIQISTISTISNIYLQVVVHTSRLCAVPWLRPVLEPTPLPIVCRPLLSEQQMEQYNRYIERRYCTVVQYCVGVHQF